MTPKQRELARHALGLPNKRRMTYRNRYVVGEGAADHGEWMAMVAAGLAVRNRGTDLTGGMDLFYLLRPGAEAALDARERLDPEDWRKPGQPYASEGGA